MGNMKSDGDKLIDFCQGRSAIVHTFSSSSEISAEQFALDSDVCKVFQFREVELVYMHCKILKILGIKYLTEEDGCNVRQGAANQGNNSLQRG